MEVDAVGRSEPDVFVEEAEASRRNVIGLGDARQHRLVDKPILERHQQCHHRQNRPCHAVQHPCQVQQQGRHSPSPTPSRCARACPITYVLHVYAIANAIFRSLFS
nr:hypothetical protein Itr_chr05CG19410 [Ipomoea trifida]